MPPARNAQHSSSSSAAGVSSSNGASGSSGKPARQSYPGLSEMFAYHATTMANTIRTSLLVFSRKVCTRALEVPSGVISIAVQVPAMQCRAGRCD